MVKKNITDNLLRVLALAGTVLFAVLCFFCAAPVSYDAFSDVSVLKLNPVASHGEYVGHFERGAALGDTVWVYAYNPETKISLNGETIFFADAPGRTGVAEGLRGEGWYSFSSPGIEPDDELIVTVPGSDGVAARTPDVYCGDGAGLYRFVLRRRGGIVALASLLLCAGMLLFAWGAFCTPKGETRNKTLALSAFVLASSLFAASGAIYPFGALFVGNSPLALAVLTASRLAVPPAAATLFYRCAKGERACSVLCGCLVAASLCACVNLALAIVGDSLFQTVNVWSAVLYAALDVVLIVCAAREYSRRGTRALRALLLAGIPLLAARLLELAQTLAFSAVPAALVPLCFAASSALALTAYALDWHEQTSRLEKQTAIRETIAHEVANSVLAQMRPAFISDMLTQIQRLCARSPQQAQDALERFSRYLRTNLAALESDSLVPFSSELEHVRNYLALEKLEMGSKLSVVCEISYTNFFVPSLCLQPLVENAVIHGLAPRARGGTLTIRAARVSGGARITIEDDGVGFDVAQQPSLGSAGIANAKLRLEHYCRAQMRVESSPGLGSTVTIDIPDSNRL